jgi:lipoprotein-releasing system ATP-binding protein
MNEPSLRLDQVHRSFRQGEATLEVLRGVDFGLAAGELAALVGPSGSGKSTLLQIAGLLELPSGGEVYVKGRACGALGDTERTGLRRDAIGFVYQFHHLLPEFTAAENVMMPMRIAGLAKGEARARAMELLGQLGLTARAEHRPSQLSGGEQQRVAIARAIANRPALLLADEPTGNLDQSTAEVVFAELVELVRGHGMAALIATHNDALAARMDRTVRLVDGVLVDGTS